MQRIIRIGSLGFAVLALAASFAFAQDSVAIGKKGEVELTRETRVGSTALKPGHYRFQHRLVDGQHYLVVNSRATVQGPERTHYEGAVGEEVARVPCRLVSTPTGKKFEATALHTKMEGDGVLSVTRIDIRGEKEGHVVTLEPQS